MKTPGVNDAGMVNINDPRYQLHANIFNGVTRYEHRLLYGNRKQVADRIYRIAVVIIWWRVLVVRVRPYLYPWARWWGTYRRES